ncbi:MAG: polysaccharide biosynthesis protein [Clostridiales Family XIII bacterium]|jgi:stage V sporulation protein B|nr:polysaccharide biosynthesis protein [Clostridiales Family XIII bacterium]
MTKKTFLYGAAILTVSGIVSKILGAVFRIPLGNIIGAEGMAYYQVAYPIYVLLLTVSIAGTPVAISRMVSEKIAFGDYYGAHRIFKVVLTMMAFVGVALSAVLYFGAGLFTGLTAGLDEAVYAMRAIAPALLFVTVLSVFRGFFQGMQNMRPTAIIQVMEQLFRVGVGLTMAIFLLPLGKPSAAAGATLGATAGAAGGLLFAFLIYRAVRKSKLFTQRLRESRHTHLDAYGRQEPASGILGTFFLIALPIMVGAAVMPIMNNIDLFIVTRRLADTGMTEEAVRALYGQLTGFAAPLINLPQVVTQAIAISLVPTVVTALKTDDREFLQHNVVLSMRTTLIIALPCTVGLFALAEPIMRLLYARQLEDAVSAAPSLTILAVGIVFLASIQTLTGILQGIERQFIPVVNLIIGACCKGALTWVLTGIPSVNIKGAAIGTVCAYVVATTLNLLAVRRHTGARFGWAQTLGKPLAAALVMGLLAFGLHRLLLPLAGNGIATLAAISAGALAYFVLLFALKSVTEEELALLPKGQKLARLYRRFARRGR